MTIFRFLIIDIFCSVIFNSSYKSIRSFISASICDFKFIVRIFLVSSVVFHIKSKDIPFWNYGFVVWSVEKWKNLLPHISSKHRGLFSCCVKPWISIIHLDVRRDNIYIAAGERRQVFCASKWQHSVVLRPNFSHQAAHWLLPNCGALALIFFIVITMFAK